MKAFAFASPRHEAEVLELLSPQSGEVELLAGGADLVGLMKKMIARPERVVSLLEVDALHGVEATSDGLSIGAVTTLDELLDDPRLDDYPAVNQAIRGLNSAQLQAQSTLGGELCQRPHCWYFRNGHGLLAQRGELVAGGDNRYHAILGNGGPAKFVSPSRLAPALIALQARVRVLGPTIDDETVLPLEFFYRTPRDAGQRENILLPNQFVTHIEIPAAAARKNGTASATYEVRHGAGPDAPLASAAAALRFDGSLVSEAMVVLGQSAPTPWVSAEATRAIVGRPVTQETAQAAGEAATARATPLSENRYKVQLARTAVKRALLLAAGLETGGF